MSYCFQARGLRFFAIRLIINVVPFRLDRDKAKDYSSQTASSLTAYHAHPNKSIFFLPKPLRSPPAPYITETPSLQIRIDVQKLPSRVDGLAAICRKPVGEKTHRPANFEFEIEMIISRRS